MFYRLLSGCARAAIALATVTTCTAVAHAQTNVAADSEAAIEAAGDAIVVTGAIAQSQAASIQEKRIALNLVDVAAASRLAQ